MTTTANPELVERLEKIADGGDIVRGALELLSDLPATDVAHVRGLWPRLPQKARIDLLTEAISLSDNDVQFEFSRLALVGLDDDEAMIRRLSVELLRESERIRVAERLAQLLPGEEDISVQAAAVEQLGRFMLLIELGRFKPERVAPIVEALRQFAVTPTTPPALRGAAIGALGPHPQPWVETLILDAYYDGDTDLLLSALYAMGVSANERWLEYLSEQMTSDDVRFRVEAAVAAGEIGSEEAVPQLIELLADEDIEVVEAAIAALGAIGGDAATETLLEFAEDAPGALTQAIADAVEASRVALPEVDREFL